ncbi:hypothetical protein BDV93DRAFT_515545 [Ceratobasidium sp. AG-I]|nr:hypothetical protein BDV93DRAFT_515545 [Ceratobasidium sp. AG-I]
MVEQACYAVVREDSSEGPTTRDLRNALQKGTDKTKIETLTNTSATQTPSSSKPSSQPSETASSIGTLYTTFRQHENLIPDAPKLVEMFLAAECRDLQEEPEPVCDGEGCCMVDQECGGCGEHYTITTFASLM